MEVNNPGCFPTVCVELSVDSLAVNTVLQVKAALWHVVSVSGEWAVTLLSPHSPQSAHINDAEGGAGTGVSFDSLPQVRGIHSMGCIKTNLAKVYLLNLSICEDFNPFTLKLKTYILPRKV